MPTYSHHSVTREPPVVQLNVSVLPVKVDPGAGLVIAGAVCASLVPMIKHKAMLRVKQQATHKSLSVLAFSFIIAAPPNDELL